MFRNIKQFSICIKLEMYQKYNINFQCNRTRKMKQMKQMLLVEQLLEVVDYVIINKTENFHRVCSF